jgi:hypothetical protein
MATSSFVYLARWAKGQAGSLNRPRRYDGKEHRLKTDRARIKMASCASGSAHIETLRRAERTYQRVQRAKDDDDDPWVAKRWAVMRPARIELTPAANRLEGSYSTIKL